jgi:hypothetical protein
LTVSDLANLTSDAKVQTINDQNVTAGSTGAPTRMLGQPCDARAFDRCAANSVCTLPTPTATAPTCLSTTTARSRACSAAATLDPFKGIMQVRGEIKEPSLWDAPDGCSTASPKYRPEAMVKLSLTRPVSKVVLSTSNPYTSFDTTVYALARCDAVPTDVWCADDQSGTSTSNRAVLELTGNPLPAQDYYIVIDSFPGGTGTTFQIDVTVTE